MSLILTRSAGQKIRIGDDIEITVTRTIGKQVSFAIDAPKNITVHREEIYQLIQLEGLNS